MKKILFFLITVIAVNISAQENDQQNSKQVNPLALQPITVTIGGDFILTGSFAASKLQRLDYFISTIYNQTSRQMLGSLNQINVIEKVSKEIKKYPLRDITLKRANGEVLKIDLLKFRLTGDFKYNPYLMNDDVIIFPSYDDERGIVDISGAVNKPIKFQFVEGDKLSDAILFAGGVDIAYSNVKTTEISRLSPSGNKEELIRVNISDDFSLKCGDRIRILADENQKLNYKILVLGEVKYPGYIYITKDSTSLADAIAKVGGFKNNADLIRSEVLRNATAKEMLQKQQLTQEYLNNSDKLLLPETQLKLKQIKESFEMARLSNLTDEDTIFFNIDNQLRVLRSEELVDFTKLNDASSAASKFIVKEGDVILVPDHFDYVYVFGQVPKVGYIKYTEGQDYKFYIDKAGGLAQTARSDDDVVVIKQKDMNWISKEKEKLKIEPGDYIYVPKEIPRTFWYTFSKTSAIISTLGSIATIILLIIKL